MSHVRNIITHKRDVIQLAVVLQYTDRDDESGACVQEKTTQTCGGLEREKELTNCGKSRDIDQLLTL